MPRFRTHAFIGGGVGFAAYCLKHSVKKTFKPETEFDLAHAAAWAAVGALGACLPDFLEPATNPNHRGFFHSFAVLSGILWLLFLSTAGSVSIAGLFILTGLGYASHLIADGFTRRSLPWV